MAHDCMLQCAKSTKSTKQTEAQSPGAAEPDHPRDRRTVLGCTANRSRLRRWTSLMYSSRSRDRCSLIVGYCMLPCIPYRDKVVLQSWCLRSVITYCTLSPTSSDPHSRHLPPVLSSLATRGTVHAFPYLLACARSRP